jgi:hypothetical protein
MRLISAIDFHLTTLVWIFHLLMKSKILLAIQNPNSLVGANFNIENRFPRLSATFHCNKKESTQSAVVITPIDSKTPLSLEVVNQTSRIFPSDSDGNHPIPISIYSFINDLLIHDFIYIVDFACRGSTEVVGDAPCISSYLHEIKVPLIINNDMHLNLYQNVSFKLSLIRKRVFLQSFLFFLSSKFKVEFKDEMHVAEYLYDMNTYTVDTSNGNSSDTSFRQIFCFVTDAIGEEERIVQQFTKAELQYSPKDNRHPIMFNEDKIQNEVYVGTISGQGMIPKLYYVCKHCEYERYQLHEVTDISPKGISTKAQVITMDGLNYIWVASYHDIGNLDAASPYLQDKSLRDMVQANDMKEEKLLLRMLLTKGNSTKYLNILNGTYATDKSLAYYPRIIVQLTSTPDTFMHPFVFDLDSYNFITCNGAIISALNVAAMTQLSDQAFTI